MASSVKSAICMVVTWLLCLCVCCSASGVWLGYAVAGNGTEYIISQELPAMLTVSNAVVLPLFAFAQNLALSPDARVLYLTLGGTCVVAVTDLIGTAVNVKQVVVAGSSEAGFSPRDGQGECPKLCRQQKPRMCLGLY
jgi:hypothetical protein